VWVSGRDYWFILVDKLCKYVSALQKKRLHITQSDSGWKHQPQYAK